MLFIEKYSNDSREPALILCKEYGMIAETDRTMQGIAGRDNVELVSNRLKVYRRLDTFRWKRLMP
jgi:hypothetical protein